MTAAQQFDLFDPARLAVREAVLKRSPSPEQRARRNKVRPVERNWDQEARAWFAEHPEALDAFCDIALELIRQAPERNYLSAKHVWERARIARHDLRWNNNATATAAAIFRERFPEHAGCFRERRSA